MRIDKKDWLILQACRRMRGSSLAALGKRIGLSQPAMSERVRKLEDASIIEGYGARIDLRRLGVGLTAIIRIETTHQGIAPYLQLFESSPRCWSAGERRGLFHRALRHRRAADLQRVVDALAVHGAVTTSLVLSSPVRKHATVEALRMPPR